ncbi:GxxExxY protein [Undibacterium pigrum]|uniref:GxxExxY protein n=2 Tax=Oxalobacteraceae TaxID=75682 RepID=A0A318IN90_9BURK|nr:GxxExxY protein [Undibacterium pigrum]
MGKFDQMPDQKAHHRDTETQRKTENDLLSEQVIGAAIEVHKHLGPGLLESAYESCLCHELYLRKLSFKRQVSLDIAYKGVEVESAYRLDLVVEDSLVLELKAIESLLPVHTAQLLTYLRLTGYKTGLLINFMVPVLKSGIKRVSL